MTDSSFTYHGRETSKGALGDVGVLLGAADQDFNKTVVLDVNGKLKSISSRIAYRAVEAGDIGSRWEAIAYGRDKIQLRRVNT